MSWLGDSFSSLTGQLSNFTKEVLAEGTEEIDDHAAELGVLNQRIKDLQTQRTAQNQEVERLREINGEINDRINSSELQLKTLTTDYRERFREKENEINVLKHKYQELEDLHQRLLTAGSSSSSHISSPIGCHGAQQAFDFPTGDEMDFSDVISSQHEINRLNDTVCRLRAERDHWKQQASHSTNQPSTDLELQLQTAVDSHHQELSALHDVYSDKLAKTKQKHEIQLSELQDKLKEVECKVAENIRPEISPDSEFLKYSEELLRLPSQAEDSQQVKIYEAIIQARDQLISCLQDKLKEIENEKSKVENLFQIARTENETIQRTIVSLHASEQALQTQLIAAKEMLQSQSGTELVNTDDSLVSSLKNKLAAAEAQISELLHDREQVCCDLYATKHKLLAQLHSSQANNAEILLGVQLARKQYSNELENTHSRITCEKQKLITTLADMKQQDVQITKNIKELEADHEIVTKETGSIIDNLGDTEHQEFIAGSIHALQLENKVLKQNNQSLETQLMKMKQNLYFSDVLKETEGEGSSLKDGTGDCLEDNNGEGNSKISLQKIRSKSNVSEQSDAQNNHTPSEGEEFDTSSYTSSFSELSIRNKELDEQVKMLQSQIDTHERDIEHFEMVKADWQIEKIALEEVLTKLRTQLRIKEMSLSQIIAQRGLLEVKKQVPSEEIKHSSSCASLGFDVEVELQKLQDQIQELMQGSARLENERDILALEKEKLLEELHKSQHRNKDLLSKMRQSETSESMSNKTDDLKEQVGFQLRIKELEDNLSFLTSERDSLLAGLEELDKHHQNTTIDIIEDRNALREKCQLLSMDSDGLKIQLEEQMKEMDNIVQKLNVCLTSAKHSDNVVTAGKNEFSSVEIETLADTMHPQTGFVTKKVNEINLFIGEKNKMIVDLKTILINAFAKDVAECEIAEDDSVIDLLTRYISYIDDKKAILEKLDSDKSELLKSIREISLEREEMEKELESAKLMIENLQAELSQTREERNQTLWEVESWVDISDGTEKMDKENINTKLQDLELDSASSKHSKESSDDSHEKYGELVQRKDELEAQVKDLELQIANLQIKKNELEAAVDPINSTFEQVENVTVEDLGRVRNDDVMKKKTDDYSVESSVTSLEGHILISNDQRLNIGKVGVDEDFLPQIQNLLLRMQQMQSHITDDFKNGLCNMKISNENLHKLLERILVKQQEGISSEVTELENLEWIEKNLQQNLSATEKENILSNETLDLVAKIPEIGQLKISFDGLQAAMSQFHNLVEGFEINSNTVKNLLYDLNKDKKSLFKKIEQRNEKINNLEKKVQETQCELQNRDQQLLAMNNILKVYKDNLDPDSITDKETVVMTSSSDVKVENDTLQISKQHKIENNANSAHFSESPSNELDRMENQVRALEREKEQILTVLNEKSRENSNLKAEVHQLMNVISAEKNALCQLHQDNAKLKKEKKNYDEESGEMTKEAVQNLSRLIRDKDVEIEALNQKNQTLLTILQQSSPDGSHIQSVLQERENLMKQLTIYKSEREQIVHALGQKHQESIFYHSEIQRLLQVLSTETHKFGVLEQQHSTIAKQYEDKQKILINTQNELINLKQRVSELEQQHVDMKMKYAELLEQRDLKEKGTITIPYSELLSKNQDIQDLSNSIREKEKHLLDKDKLLHDYKRQIHESKEVIWQKDNEIVTLEQQAENLLKQIGNVEPKACDTKTGIEATEEKLQVGVKVFSDPNMDSNQEKDNEKHSSKEKITTELLSKDGTSDEELQKQLLMGSENQTYSQKLQHEYDQIFVALNQQQQGNRQLQDELRQTQEREKRLKNEVERLRVHLIQVEDSYTQEALHAEEREKELRNRLTHMEDRCRNASSSYTNASFQTTLQLESLQEQLQNITQQRDQSLLQLDKADDRIQQLTASFHTLQIVLERFQQEKDIEISQIRQDHIRAVQQEQEKVAYLSQNALTLQQRLDEATEALDAASRLSEKLDDKEETIAALKEAISVQENNFQKLQDEMNTITNVTEGRIDRSIVKNLVVNYLIVPHNQRIHVLRIIGTVLDFNHEERIKTGLDVGSTTWIPRWFTGKSAEAAKDKNQPSSQSLSAAFVQFLEKESSRIPAMKLPTERIGQDRIGSTRNANPFTIGTISENRTTANLSPSHLLMKPMASTLPTFAPVPVADSGAIANTVLKQIL